MTIQNLNEAKRGESLEPDHSVYCAIEPDDYGLSCDTLSQFQVDLGAREAHTHCSGSGAHLCSLWFCNLSSH